MEDQNRTSGVLIGESYVGEGAEAAHINTGPSRTLFVNKAPMADEQHGNLTWGAAQAGVAGGVADAVADGVISAEDAERLVLIAAVWVNPAARHAALVYQNNRAATRNALENSVTGAPKLDEILAARHEPANPFFTLE